MFPEKFQSHLFPDDDLVTWTFGALAFVEDYLGKPLVESFHQSGIKRALEVGVGTDFSSMKQLARLARLSVPFFAPDNLLAIDKGLWSDNQLQRMLGTYGNTFQRERLSAAELRNRVVQGAVEPFDLILSRGVVSVGYFAAGEGTAEDWVQEALQVTSAMRDCMRKDNPNALLVLESQFEEEVLLFSKQHLASIGLTAVYTKHVATSDWIKILQKRGIFPRNPREAGFKLAICKAL